MNCKVCNTRLSPGDRACPNCGTEAPKAAAFQRSSSPAKLPAAGLSTARDPEDELELDDLGADPDELDEDLDDNEDIELEDLEVEVEEEQEEEEAPPPPRKAPPPPPPAKAAPAPKPPPAEEASPTDPRGLRALLADDPETLEKGLSVYKDKGRAVGARYSTGVGPIDLLATDGKGDLVVVMIAETDQGEELVAEVLQRIGWVRKHLGGGKKGVRGIVLCHEVPESLSYAAAAVADTVSFKTYRLALVFEDLEF